jgi:pimeloyl-ACP methyl ester carboxylesterase
MNVNKTLLSFLVSLIVVQACQSDNVVATQKTPAKTDFDPAIIRALQSYKLGVADSAPGQQDGGSIERFNGQVTQKTVTIGQERIVYFETSGKGPDILLVHGNGQSSNAFALQLKSPLGSIFHIISIDLPGHGLSSRSPNPATTYQLPGFANVLASVVKKLNMERAVIVGWSLGGSILFEAADQLPHIAGLMAVGAPPVANPFDPNAFLPSPVAGLLFQQDLTEDQIQAIVPSFFKPNAQHIPEVFFQDVRIQDPLVRFNLGVMLATGNYKDEPSVVRHLSVPVAFVEGEQEQLTNIAYIQGLTIPTLWHNRVWTVPNAGHIAQWENPDFFNVLLAAFVLETNSSRTHNVTGQTPRTPTPRVAAAANNHRAVDYGIPPGDHGHQGG